MLIINLLNTSVISAKEFLRDRKAYAELSRLDSYLLEDMGIQLINGKVVNTRIVSDVENNPVAHPALTVIVNKKATASSQFEPPPVLSTN